MSNKLLRRGVSYLLAFLMIFTTIFATNFYSAKAEEIDIEENTLSEDDGLLLDDAAVADDVDIADEEILEDETADAKEVVLSEPEGNPTFVNSGLVIRSEETTDFAKSTELQIAAEYNFYLGINQGDDAESIDNSNVISLDSEDNVTLFKFYPGDDEPTDYPGDYTITPKGNDLYTLTVKGCSCGEYGFRWDGDDGYKGSSVTFMLTAPVLNVFDSSAHNEENNTYVFNKENELATNPTLSFEDALYGKKDFIVFIPNNSYDSSKTSIAIRGLNKIKAGKEEDWTEEDWTTMMAGKGDERLITDHVDGMYVNGFDEKKANFNGAEIDGEVCKVVMKKDEANMPAISSYCVEIGTITDDVFTPAYRVSYAPYVCDENTFADVVVDDAEFCGENVFSNPYLKGDADKKILWGLDYSLEDYKNNINIGEASVELTPSADFAGAEKFELKFNITPMDLAKYIDDENIDVSVYAYYNPTEKKVYSYKIDSQDLCENVDYTVDYGYVYDSESDAYVKASGDPDPEKTYFAKLTGMGDFAGDYYASYLLKKKKINLKNFYVVSNPVYDGTEKTGADFEFRFIIDGANLVYGKDFVVKYDGVDFAKTNASAYNVTIEGIGAYEGFFTTTVEIDAIDLSKAEVKYLNSAGKEIALPKEFTFGDKLTPVVYYKGKKLDSELYDAKIEPLNPVDNTGVFIVSGKGFNYNVFNFFEKSITLKPNFTSKNISVEFENGDSYVYTGKEIEPSVIVKQGETVIDGCIFDYANNVNVGEGKVLVVADGSEGYFGAVEKEFTITSVQADDLYVYVDPTATYNPAKEAGIPYIEVKATETSDDVIPAEDYKVTYIDNDKVGAASCKIEFLGKNIKGSPIVREFSVLPADLTEDLWCPDHFFGSKAGEMEEPNIDVFWRNTEITLVAGKDYEISFSATETEPKGAVEDGMVLIPAEGSFEYKATITGKGNFMGTDEFILKALLFSPVDISSYKVEGLQASYESDFNPWDELDKIVLKDGDDEANPEYTVDFDYSEINEYGVGTGSFIICGKAPYYKGSIVVSVKVIPVDLEKHNVSLNECTCPYIDEDTLELVEPNFYVCVDDDYCLREENYTVTYAVKNDDGTYTDLKKLTAELDGEIFVKLIGKSGAVGESDYLSVGKIEKISLRSFMNFDKGIIYTVSAPKDFTYDGKAHKQKLTVKIGNKKLTVGKDCKFIYYDVLNSSMVEEPVNSGFYVTMLQGIGKYCDVIEELVVAGKPLTEENMPFFTISPASLSKAKVTYTKSFDFDASKLEDDGFSGWGEVSKVQVGKKELIKDFDYVVTYEDNFKPGVATVTITGKGNYTGTVAKTYTIKGTVDINDTDVFVAEEAPFAPAGAKPEITITYKGRTLVADKDYSVSYTGNKTITKDKKATVTIKGKGQYKGTYATKPEFSVVAGDLSELSDRMTYGKAKEYSIPMFFEEAKYFYGVTYTGKAQTPDPKLQIDGKALKLGKDYKIRFITSNMLYGEFAKLAPNVPSGIVSESVVTSGEYKVEFVGIGNYAGEYIPEELSLWVTAPAASKLKIKTKALDYTGTEAEGAVTSIMYGKTKLVEKRDYFVIYDYEFQNFTAEEMFLLSEHINIPSLKAVLGNSINIPQRINIVDSISAGKHTAYVVGAGNYATLGVIKVPYTIKGFDINKAKFTVKNITYCPDAEYVDFNPKDDITATYTVNGETLHLLYGVDYEIANLEDIMKNFKAGKLTAKVAGIGQFSGTKKVTVKVVPIELSMDSFDYDLIIEGWNTEYAFLTKNGVKNLFGGVYYGGCILKEGVDYTVTYKNNKKIASADSKKAPTVTIKFKGNFKGTFTKKFNIVKNDIRDTYFDYTGGTTDNYKIKPVLYYLYNGKLKEGTDYKLVGYYYEDGGWVENNGKLCYRLQDEAVRDGDKIFAGTNLYAEYEGTGKYYEGKLYVYYTVKPATK